MRISEATIWKAGFRPSAAFESHRAWMFWNAGGCAQRAPTVPRVGLLHKKDQDVDSAR